MRHRSHWRSTRRASPISTPLQKTPAPDSPCQFLTSVGTAPSTSSPYSCEQDPVCGAMVPSTVFRSSTYCSELVEVLRRIALGNPVIEHTGRRPG